MAVEISGADKRDVYSWVLELLELVRAICPHSHTLIAPHCPQEKCQLLKDILKGVAFSL